MAEVLITAKDNGTSRSLAIGTRLSVQLAENPTTGYKWHLRQDPKPVLTLVSDDYAVAQSSGVGGGGLRQFVFAAKQAGDASLELVNRRQWEDETKAEARFSLNVQVVANAPGS